MLIKVVTASVVGLLFCTAALAETIAKLQVLAVGTGAATDMVDGTRSAIEARPQTTIGTTTIWTEGM